MGEPAILIVDDEAAHLRALSRALSGMAEVRVAGGGGEAIRAVDAGGVGLLISDQRMEGMAGIELLGAVRQRSPETVLVLLTAYADLTLLQRAVNEIGVYHYLEKPWNLAELRQVVARGLERFALERERRELIERLRASCAAVQREVDYKNRLLAVLAHELGTPAHITVNAVGLLLELPLDAAARRWIEALRRAADWLARGVAQMQRASAVDSGGLRLRRGAVDLGSLAGAARRELLVVLGDRAVEVVEQPQDEGSVVVRGDRRWLHHVVWSLLTNAVRFTPDGGRVVLTVCRGDGVGCLIVQDSGIGFGVDELEDAFVAFSRASGDPVLHGSGWLAFGARGLGLGLALAKKIVDAHGGRIAIDSAPGRGTVVRVELPLLAEDRAKSG